MKTCIVRVVLAGSLLWLPLSSHALAAATPPQQSARQAWLVQQSNDRGQRRGGFGMGTGGTIQSTNGDTITLTTRDGSTATVKVTSDTRFVRDGQAAKLSDFKSGDRVIVRGESSGENNWKAQMVASGMMRGPGAGQGGGFGSGSGAGNSAGNGNGAGIERMREGMGKDFVAGTVKSIDGTKLVVHAADKDFTVEVDENTSFHKGRESITFPDVKAGDRVVVRGKPNSAGVFVAETLNVGGMFANGPGSETSNAPAPPKQ